MRATDRRWAPLLAALLALALPAPSASAASPQLGALLPRGGPQGAKQLRITCYGRQLRDARALLWEGRGITTTRVWSDNPNRCYALIDIAPDAPRGEHKLRVVTASGVSDLRTFWVDAWPTVRENERLEAQPIRQGVTVEGRLTPEDVDRYTVQAFTGQRLTAEVTGIRLGGAFFDPHLTILDERGRELASSDDTAKLRQDPSVSLFVPYDGVFTLVLRDAAYRGNGNAWYRMQVGQMMRPQVAYPAGGPAGQPLAVTLLGDPLGARQLSVVPPADGRLWAAGGETFPSPVSLRPSHLPNVLEREPNPRRQPTEVKLPAAINGVIGAPGDFDHFRLQLAKGQRLDLQVLARSIGSPLDPVLTIHRASDGRYLGGNDDAGNGAPDSRLRYTAPAAGAYLLRVYDHRRRGGPTFIYRIEPVRNPPLATLTIPQFGRYSQALQHVAVPQGGRYAALIQVRRSAFAGSLDFSLLGLPKGVTAQAPTLGARVDRVPVIFSAEPKAPLGQAMVPIGVVPKQPRPGFHSRFMMPIQLVRGPPNQATYHQPIASALAVATTRALPFRIELAGGQAPLVQGGSQVLRIKVIRAKGFRGQVQLRMLYNPPGVSSPGRVVVPGNQSDAAITLTAGGGARTGRWPICLIGFSNIGGAVWTSSGLVDLDVAPPFAEISMPRSAVTQGTAINVGATIKVKRSWQGQATVRLVGLPPGVQSRPVMIGPGAKAATIPLLAGSKARPGRYRSVICQLLLNVNGQPVLHRAIARLDLRVDRPRPKPKARPVVNKPKPAPQAKPKPKPAAPPSRLEQLRQQAKEGR